MKKHGDIEKLADQTLNSLDGLQEVEANGYLYAKIKQRMHDNNEVVPLYGSRIMLRLAAVLILFISINCISFYALKQQKEQMTAPGSNDVSAFASAYGLNTNTDSY
jgi:hypothetical protein